MELILGKSKAKLQLEATLKQIEVLEHSVDQQMEILLPIYTRMKGVMTDAGTGSRTALAPRRGTQKFKLPPKVANSDSLSMNMRTMNRLLKRYKQSGENGHSVSELGAMYLQAISMVKDKSMELLCSDAKFARFTHIAHLAIMLYVLCKLLLSSLKSRVMSILHSVK